MTNSNPNRRRGGTIVEISLVGSLFFILLLGILDIGQALFLQLSIGERARSAARWGAVTDPTNSGAIQNMVLYLQPTAPVNRTPSFGLTPEMVSVATADAGTDNYRLTVRISGYSDQMLSPYFAPTYQGAPINISIPLGSYF